MSLIDMGTIRKGFIVYGNNKLHQSAEQLRAQSRIVSATITKANGDPVELSGVYNDLISIHYPLTVSLQPLNLVISVYLLSLGYWVVYTRS